MSHAFYTTPEEMQEKIDEYFNTQVYSRPFLDNEGHPCYSKQGKILYEVKPPTVSGLALYLGFSNRSSMYNYKDDMGKEFSHTIKNAITRVEEYAETQLTQGNSTGAIFWLKNHGWKDSSELKTPDLADVNVPARQSREEWEATINNIKKLGEKTNGSE